MKGRIIALRIDDRTLEELDNIAKKENKTRSEVIRGAIRLLARLHDIYGLWPPEIYTYPCVLGMELVKDLKKEVEESAAI